MDYLGSTGPIILFIMTVYNLFHRKPFLYVYFISYLVLMNMNSVSLGFSNTFLLLSQCHMYWIVAAFFVTLLSIYRHSIVEVIKGLLLGAVYAYSVFYLTVYYLETQTENKDEFIYM